MLALHGGAGRVSPAPEAAREARAGLADALAAGGRVLADGGEALLAAVAAVRVLEDCPAFNAGRGAVLDARGAVALDAAVMAGSGRRAGAVAGVSRLAHPVDAAFAVLRDGRHVLLAGTGAEELAFASGLARVDPERHVTERRRAQLARVLAADASGGGGTVGAVARDAAGHLAAATSTGGTVAKRPGRVSDSALVGSGTWADDATCAVSATGHGESFIRCAFAHEVDARMRHAGASLEAACAAALAEVAALGGSGGCAALDASGRVALPFDTPDMPRGVWRAGAPRVAVYGGEDLEAPRP